MIRTSLIGKSRFSYLKYAQNISKIYKTLSAAPTCACHFERIYPTPTPQEKILFETLVRLMDQQLFPYFYSEVLPKKSEPAHYVARCKYRICAGYIHPPYMYISVWLVPFTTSL